MTIETATPDFDQEWTTEPTYDPAYEEEYISASRIKKFAKCPLSYKLAYIDGFRDQKIDKGYLALGTAVHEAIEYVLYEDPPFDASRLSRDFKREYRSRSDDVPESMFDDGLDYLDVAARYVAGNIDDVLDIEAKTNFGLERSDIDASFFGYIDLTTPTKVIDWKTGKIRDDTAKEEAIQGAVYMMGYHDLYGEPPESVNFVYLKEQTERSLDPSDELWEKMISHASDLVRAMDRDEFPARPGDACFWCSSEFSCPDPRARGYGHVDWEKF